MACAKHAEAVHEVGRFVFCRTCGQLRQLTNQELHLFCRIGQTPPLRKDPDVATR